MDVLCNTQLLHHLLYLALPQSSTGLTFNVYPLFLLSSPHGWDLIFHLICAQLFVDGVHYFITLETASSSIKAGNDDFLCAAEVRGPLQPELIVHILTPWTCIPLIHKTSPFILIFIKNFQATLHMFNISIHKLLLLMHWWLLILIPWHYDLSCEQEITDSD